MSGYRYFILSAALLVASLSVSGAHAMPMAPLTAALHGVTEFDQDVTPDVINGSGIANGDFTTDRANGVELAIRGKLRFDANGSAQNIFNSNGNGTYTFIATEAPNRPDLQTAQWSFDWSVNSDFDGTSGLVLDQLTYELGLDGDPSAATDFLTFDPITPTATTPLFDHAIGTNLTGNGGGTIAANAGDYETLLASNNVAQNSWRYDFFISGALLDFDPKLPGTYDLYLRALDGGNEVARVDIQILVVEPDLKFSQNVTPDAIFGGGNANGGYTTDQRSDVELALRGKLRFATDGGPENTFNDNGDGTYTFIAQRAPDRTDPSPEWGFEWSVNTNFNGGAGRQLDALVYEIGLDGDPGEATDYLTFDPITPGVTQAFWDHSIGTNATANGGGTEAGDVATYENLLANNNVAQNSWRYTFFDNELPQPNPLAGFNPTIPGVYDLYLEARDPITDVLVARTEIRVIVELPPLAFDQDIEPEVIFGSGNINGFFTTDRRSDVQIGLRTKLRFDATGQPQNIFNSNGDGTYFFNNIVAPTKTSPTPEWSFEWSVNTDFNASGGPSLDSYTYEIGLDGDPGLTTEFLVFDPITPTMAVPFFDHALGDRNTGNGGGTSAGDAGTYTSLLSTETVAQNSWRYDFFLSGPLAGFDPTAVGTYDIYLLARDADNNVIARSEIQVLVGGAPAGNTADLALTKSTTATGLQHIGDAIDYTLVVTNNDLATATSVVLTDTLPANLAAVSGSCTDGTMGVIGASDVTFSLSDIDAGDTTTCTVSTTVSGPGNILNTASVTADNEGNAADNTAESFLYAGLVQSTNVTGDMPSAADNDYTRINDAVQNAVDGNLIILEGFFDWTETNAFDSWALGSDGVADSDDEFYLLIPAGLSDITMTAMTQGDATIAGPGDLASVDLEGFLLLQGTHPGWTISNLVIEEFDVAIGMYFNGGGVNVYDGTLIDNNLIRMARDVPGNTDAGEGFQNIGIHFAFGDNQTISNNIIEIPGDAISTDTFTAASVGMQSNTSGGAYEGLLIENNEIRVLNAPSDDPEFVLGIWENGAGHTRNITVRNNRFLNLHPDNDPALNNQEGFRIHSHSSASSTVLYEGNYVEGAARGFRWLPGGFGADFSAREPVEFIGNTALNNGTGIRLESNGAGNFRCNRIAGNTLGIENATDAMRVSTANDNWWGCNAGPNGGACDGFDLAVTADSWLVADFSADDTMLVPGEMANLTLDVTSNSDGLAVADCTLPETPVTFAAIEGDVTPASTDTMAGLAPALYTAVLPGGPDVATATIDAESLDIDFDVQLVTGMISIVLDANTSLDFSYSGDLGAFTLDDDADATLSNTFMTTVPVGSYDVTQVAPAGFALADIACVDPDSGSTSSGSTATIDLDDGESITCTFTNADTWPDLGVAISQSTGPFFPGDTVQYDITVSNQNEADATGVVLNVQLDGDLSLVSTTGCANDPNGAPTCTVGSLAGNSQTTVSVTAQIMAMPADALLTSVSVSANEPERDGSDNSAFIATGVGDAVGTITIVQNTSPDDAQDFAYSGDLGVFSLDDDADGTLPNVAVFSVAAGTYGVTQGPVTGFRLDALVCTDPDGGTGVAGATATIDLDNGENIQCEFFNVPEVTLDLSAMSDTDPVTAGGSFSVLVDVESIGNATGVVLTTTALPAGVTLTGSSGCTEAGAGAFPNCTIGSIASGGDAQVTLSFDVATNVTANPLALDFTVDANEDLAAGSNAAATVTVGLQRSTDLAVTIDDGADATFENTVVDYNVVVTNDGPSDAVDASVLVTLDDEHDAGSASWVCVAGAGASCTASGTGTLSDTLSLEAGATATYTLSVNVIDGVEQGAMLDAVATVSAGTDQSDSVAANDTDTDSNLLNTSDQLEEIVFLDGFEEPPVTVKTADFEQQARVVITTPATATDQPTDWAQLGDTPGSTQHLLQVMASGEGQVWLRAVVRDRVGQRLQTMGWMAVQVDQPLVIEGHPDYELRIGLEARRPVRLR